MTVSLKHQFVSPKGDSADPTLIQPSNWNSEHTITLAHGKVLGRVHGTDGAVQELPISVDGDMQSMRPPIGTTAERPAIPLVGMMRYNSTTSQLETYHAGEWVSMLAAVVVSPTAPLNPQQGSLWYDQTTLQLKVYNGTAFVLPQADITINTFSGNGVTKAFTLSADPGFENNLSIFVGSDYVPKTLFSVSGTTLTFAVAPVAGVNNIEVTFLSSTVTNVPADGSVTPAKLASGAVSTDALASNAVSTSKIQSNAVNNSKLASGAVTFNKMNSAAVATSTANTIASSPGDVTLTTAKAVKDYVDAAVAAALTPAVLGAAIAAIPAGSVGSIALMRVADIGAVVPGQIVSAANVAFCGYRTVANSGGSFGFQIDATSGDTGTWMSLGYIMTSGAADFATGLFMRVT